jgi:hypothetical protein
MHVKGGASPAEAIAILNRGAYVYWSFEGASNQFRTNSIMNGAVTRLYLPIVIRHP